MKNRAALLTIAAAVMIGGLVSAVALRAQTQIKSIRATPSQWQQIDWPFPMDQWGKGTAYRCKASDCGADVEVYLRAKVGFCRCKDGMTSDGDLDRVSDFDLFGGALYPQAPGQAIAVAWMKGRRRPFAIQVGGSDRTMLSIGLHDNCDALAITAVLPRGRLGEVEPVVLDFIRSKTVARWASDTLGL